MSTKIIVMANNKGGVGKTSSVAALGDVFSRKLGKKVLLIDADPQGNLSHLFGYGVNNPIQNTFGAYLHSELMFNNGSSRERLQPSLFFNEATLKRPASKLDSKYKTLHIMCTMGELDAVYENFSANPSSSEFIIQDFLTGLKDSEEFDYVFIDTSPTLTNSLGQYLVGSDYLIVPLPPSEFAVSGAEKMMETFKYAVNKKARFVATNRNLEFLGFFFCEVAEKGIADKMYRQNRGNLWDERTFFSTSIPKRTSVLNAENKGAPVTAVYPSSSASWNYVSLAREIRARIKKAEEGMLYE